MSKEFCSRADVQTCRNVLDKSNQKIDCFIGGLRNKKMLFAHPSALENSSNYLTDYHEIEDYDSFDSISKQQSMTLIIIQSKSMETRVIPKG